MKNYRIHIKDKSKTKSLAEISIRLKDEQKGVCLIAKEILADKYNFIYDSKKHSISYTEVI